MKCLKFAPLADPPTGSVCIENTLHSSKDSLLVPIVHLGCHELVHRNCEEPRSGLVFGSVICSWRSL